MYSSRISTTLHYGPSRVHINPTVSVRELSLAGAVTDARTTNLSSRCDSGVGLTDLFASTLAESCPLLGFAALVPLD